MLENPVKSIYIGIGSNLGNKKKNIEKTKFKLIKNNIDILHVSSYYESLSWPNPNKPRFFNIILKVKSDHTAFELIKICKNIENQMGRKKTVKNAPRICDIDIIDFKNKKVNDGLILPHPRMHTRNFVLLPLFELDKNWTHPVLKRNIKKLLLSLSNSDIRSIKQI